MTTKADATRLRPLKHISPSMLKLYLSGDDREFYLRYIAEERPPRPPQTRPMSVGSAFDAYVKSYLADCLGMEGFDLEELLVSQVEAPVRDWAREAGKEVFNVYRESGALADLMAIVNRCSDIRMEFLLSGEVRSSDLGLGGACSPAIPFKGYPDMCLTADTGGDATRPAVAVLDWKVNGYCSKASPKPGYLKLREPRGFAGRGGMIKCHKNTIHAGKWPNNGGAVVAQGAVVAGVLGGDPEWELQLCIYGWLLGFPVGTPFMGMIDQIVRGPYGLRVATFRGMIGEAAQLRVWGQCRELWEREWVRDKGLEALGGGSGDGGVDAWFAERCR